MNYETNDFSIIRPNDILQYIKEKLEYYVSRGSVYFETYSIFSYCNELGVDTIDQLQTRLMGLRNRLEISQSLDERFISRRKELIVLIIAIEQRIENTFRLFTAIRHHNIQDVRLLIQEGVFINEVDSDTGDTPLLFAIRAGNQNIIKLLLLNKSNVNHPDNRNFTPLHRAIYRELTNVTEMLLVNDALILSPYRTNQNID